MKIFTKENLELKGGQYYTPKLWTNESVLVIAIKTDGLISGRLEKSITETDWDSVDNSSFVGADYKELNIYDIPKGQLIRLILDQEPIQVSVI